MVAVAGGVVALGAKKAFDGGATTRTVAKPPPPSRVHKDFTPVAGGPPGTASVTVQPMGQQLRIDLQAEVPHQAYVVQLVMASGRRENIVAVLDAKTNVEKLVDLADLTRFQSIEIRAVQLPRKQYPQGYATALRLPTSDLISALIR
ncbi:MAG: hypothetical protein M3065_15605 [Actinomycetota bacterium]|nr:hypothetical protein [Actinomycetota bacterium]